MFGFARRPRALAAAALIAFMSAAAKAAPTTIAVALSGGREAIVEKDELDSSAPWLVYFPGSDCARFDPHDHFVLKALRKTAAFNVVVINKAGVGIDGSCRTKEFELSSTRTQRLDDIRVAMNRILPKNARVLVVGESEGGYITPDVARDDDRVVGMLWVSGGTRSWIEEEISFVPKSRRAKLRRFFEEEVRTNPTFDLHYNGWTYAQLVSFDGDFTVRALNDLDKPALLLNGELDGKTWVAATTEDLEWLIGDEEKSNLEFHLLEGADHGLHCAQGATCTESGLRGQVTKLIESFVGRLRL